MTPPKKTKKIINLANISFRHKTKCNFKIPPDLFFPKNRSVTPLFLLAFQTPLYKTKAKGLFLLIFIDMTLCALASLERLFVQVILLWVLGVGRILITSDPPMEHLFSLWNPDLKH